MAEKEVYNKYQPVIGLEIHAQLQTQSKMYSGDSNSYGDIPNSNVSAISLGHPGTLPRVNEKAINYAIKMGIATNCKVNEFNGFARKNYFYADLPKGYQITQDKTPICTAGFLDVNDENKKTKRIGITRIHLEEDSGKSIHDQDPYNTLIDLNRAGVPLIEIVSEPDLRSSTEAYNYLSEIRKIVRYLEICDGNMEEGSMRCDANISVCLKGAKEFGQRAEIKNMNSIRNVKRAIEHEIKRQIEEVEAGGTIAMETRGFNAVEGTTFSMRAKEMAHDYRYFPEPDLLPFLIKEEEVEKIQKTLPPLPDALYEKYTKEYKLSEYDAGVLTEDKATALYFEELCHHTKNKKAAANWVMGAIRSYLNEQAVSMAEFSIPAKKIASLIQLIDENKISNTIASQNIFPVLIEKTEADPETIAKENGWIQESDEDFILQLIQSVLDKYPDKVETYKNGHKGLKGLFMGEIMKQSKGKADPKLTNKLLTNTLEN